ncbi:PD40 domain-containing protein [candidate division KSB1 bacterium]|nr:PD40 domain-containing protein [candidate division KSB1 bacterium]
MTGKTISHYKILEKLGSGGMGVVYKAHDTRLKRTVALKFLPAHALDDDLKRNRFLHEAQAAAALNHPNICTIYEISDVPEPDLPFPQTFIAMEYVAGRTLQEIARAEDRTPLPLSQIIDIAIQIAGALREAHEKGVIHRDIKSANIMLTDKGQVKIMDFGLAKSEHGKDITRSGSTIGTVAYMSPEQARGETIDHRADIWSVGVVLYELLTGQLPFQGANELAMAFSILDDEPAPLTRLRFDVPPGVAQLVFKCMAKEKTGRYQTADKLLQELLQLKDSKGVMEQQLKAPLRPRKIKLPPRAIKAAFATMLVALLIFLLSQSGIFREKITAPRIVKFRALTRTTEEFECDAQISPDGTRIAYQSERSGNWDVWVLQIASGQKMNLTPDYEGNDHTPHWSPDGNWIAFRSERDGGGIYIMSEYGGNARQVIPLDDLRACGDVSWSPNGVTLAVALSGSLYTVNVNGGIPKQIPLPNSCFSLCWSPDGDRIAYQTWQGEDTQIWTVQPDGADPIPIFTKPGSRGHLAWSGDGKRIFFKRNREKMREIWWLPVDEKGKPTAPAKPLSAAANFYDFSLSHDGTKLVYLGGEGPEGIGGSLNIWSIPVDADSLLDFTNAEQITHERQQIAYLTLSPDHEWFAFQTLRKSQFDIWRVRRSGGELQQVTRDSIREGGLNWSPDGSRIAFHVGSTISGGICTVPVNGGPITLCDNTSDAYFPAWSPDGEEIAFNSDRSGNWDIWVLSLKNGTQRQLTDSDADEALPSWSPDGRTIAFWHSQQGVGEIYLIPVDGGEARQLTHIESVLPLRSIWSPDGKTLFVIYDPGKDDPGRKIIAVSVANGTVRKIFEFKGRSMGGELTSYPSLATDGENLYFIAGYVIGEIMLADLVYE